jgi:diketogulonate reductase-like aldo/keto reductase
LGSKTVSVNSPATTIMVTQLLFKNANKQQYKVNGITIKCQVLVRWSLQHGLVVIPKPIYEKRIRENSQVFDFQLAPEDMKLLDLLNENLQTVFLG